MGKYEAIAKIIQQVGFPIVMCLLMGWYINEQTEAQNEILTNLTISINNNTKAVEKLDEKIKYHEMGQGEK